MKMTVDVSGEIINKIEKDARKQNDLPEKYVASILNKHYRLEADFVAYWYFRLNGFLTTVNFVVHPPRHGSQRTDADVFGIRFPNRNEDSLKDDKWFEYLEKPMLAITEVTTGNCKINGPWSNSEKENIQYVLNAIGLFSPDLVDGIAKELYRNGRVDHELALIQMFAVGKDKTSELSIEFPHITQLTFVEMLDFIYRRFKSRWDAKKDHQHWDQTGKLLWELSAHVTLEKFIERAENLLGID